jgi:phage repressor protein C with HTH and peptisase S24 domain
LPHHVGTVLYTGILIGVRDDRHVGRRGHARPFPGRIETQGREIREETARRILTVYIKEAVIRPPLTVLDTGVLSQNKSVPDEANYKLVPVIHVDSVGGVHSRNDIVNESQFVEGYVPFVNAQDDDRAIYQSGNSMIPTIPPGSLLQIREVPNWKEFFGYGNIFVIELTDGRRITKEINKYEENPKEYVWCHSHNPSVADEELPKNMIVSVWKVIKVLTDKGW